MYQTLIGVFDTRAQANEARDQLLQSGFAPNDVIVQTEAGAGGASPDAARADYGSSQQQEGGIAGFFRSLFGMDESDEHVGVYSEAARRGGQIVSVHVQDETQAERAHEVLIRCGAVDLDERSTQWRSEGWGSDNAAALSRAGAGPIDSAPATSTGMAAGGITRGSGLVSDRGTATERDRIGATGELTESQRIPVVQEELQVGKRQVRTGGVRVFTRVAETPVEESVRLTEEHARVERHPVDRPATEADFAAMREGTIELRETAEEAVVGKRARVVEEVEVGKQRTERTETIRDTVRHTEVEVENLERERAMARDGTLADGSRGPGVSQRSDDVAGGGTTGRRDTDRPV